MWFFDLIPSWVVHLTTFSGLVAIVGAFVLGFVPFVSRYKTPIMAVGILALSAGLFLEGALYSNDSWNQKTLELEVKLAEAEALSQKENVRIITKYKDKVRIIKDNTNENIKYIEKYVTVNDSKCELPNSVIVLHDSASQNTLPPTASGALEGTSDVKISQLTETVVDNYGTCYQIREQLKAWQDWYNTNKGIFEKAFN